MSELAQAVQQLAERVTELESHVPRVGALEHREIVLSSSLVRFERTLTELHDIIFKFDNDNRRAIAELNANVLRLVEARR